MKVVILEPEKEPYSKEIGNKLEDLQEVVNGYIQVIGDPFGNANIVMIVNEEGKLKNLKINTAIVYKGAIIDIVVGSCILAGYNGDEIVGLTEEQELECINYYTNNRNIWDKGVHKVL